MNKDLQNNINYIRKKTGKNSGFSTPKGYFNTLEDEICDKLSVEKHSKKTAFEVPKNYFYTLENEIIAKISSEEKNVSRKKTTVIPLRRVIPFAVAVTIALLFLLPFFNNSDTITSINTISIAELENWYENNHQANNEINELAILLNDNDFDDTEILPINFSEQTLEDYLNLEQTENYEE